MAGDWNPLTDGSFGKYTLDVAMAWAEAVAEI